MYNSEAPIGDELLSAWLDDELSPEDRQRVAAALATQATLAARLEQLRLANDLTRQHARVIDALPLSPRLDALLAAAPERTSAEVIAMPVRHTWRLTQPVALAASVLLTLGLGFGLLRDNGAAAGAPDLHAALLAEVRSGDTLAVGELQLSPRFSFRNSDGQWCRLYRVDGAAQSLDNVACHDGSTWLQQASLPAAVQDDSQYLPATSDSRALDTVLDELMQGAPLALDMEERLIDNGWSTAD